MPETQSALEKESVYVVIINYNRWADTVECIESILKSTYPNFRVVVVDNSSTDGSPQIIAEKFPQVEILANEQNLGFPGGVNSGLTYAMKSGAGYFLVINNDTYIDQVMIASLVQHASQNIGIIAPVIYYAAHPQTVWSAGGKTNPLTLEIRHYCQNAVEPIDWPEVVEQDFVTGCAFLCPREALEKVGLMDPDYFWYYDDPDFSIRMRRAGLRILVVPKARMWHKVAMTSGGVDSPKERYWMARSSVRFFYKFARGWQIPAVIFWRTGSALRTTLRLVRKGKWESLRSYWRGLWDGFAIVRKNDPRQKKLTLPR